MLALTENIQVDGLPRCDRPDHPDHAIGRIDFRPSNLQDDIPDFKSRYVGWIPLKNRIDDDPFPYLRLRTLGHLLRNRVYADTQPTPMHLTMLHQLFHHMLDHVRGNRKANALGIIDDRRVDTNHFPFYVKKRSSTITRINGSVRLYEIFVARKIYIFSLQAADNAKSGGVVESIRIAHCNNQLPDPDFA